MPDIDDIGNYLRYTTTKGCYYFLMKLGTPLLSDSLICLSSSRATFFPKINSATSGSFRVAMSFGSFGFFFRG